MNESRDSGVWSGVINIYIENSKHPSKEHHHHQEGKSQQKTVERKSNEPCNIQVEKVVFLRKSYLIQQRARKQKASNIRKSKRN